MKKAIKILGGVADVGFDLKKPEDRQKRHELVAGLFDLFGYHKKEKEAENVETETQPIPAE
jgi:hypothetical protein